MVAGVCGGLGRATGTDPVLWRVLTGALVLFGLLGHWPAAALGILAYVAAWVLLPEEGDEASPLEALLGRGTSSVSATVTIVLLVIGALVASSLVGSAAVIPAALLLGSAAVLGYHLYRNGQLGGHPAPATATPAPDAPAAAVPTTSMSEAPTQAYSPPFAPHGPYGDTPPPPPPPAPPCAPTPPKPPRERSRLGRVTVSLVFLAVGALAVIDLLGTSVPASTYFAVALAVVALGLLVGAVAGRARGLIVLGLLLTLGLGIASAAERIDIPRGPDGDVTLQPDAMSDLPTTYRHRFGVVTLDLRGMRVDPTKEHPPVRVQGGAGEVIVLVEPDTDVNVDASVGAGQIDVLGHRTGGIGRDLKIADEGDPGGAELDIVIELGAGNVEVRREAA
jgi:phage shock protein PspC (stress-responsive transcriptional regulator)